MYKIAPLTVGLRDDMDSYYQEHDQVPSRAWVLSRILLDPKTDKPLYTEEEIRNLPLSSVEDAWSKFQEAIDPAPLDSAPPEPSSTG